MGVADEVFVGAELVDVGVGVTVRTIGTSVAIGMTVFPDRIVVEIVAVVVVRESETDEEELVWAAAEWRRRRRPAAATAGHDRNRRGSMSDG